MVHGRRAYHKGPAGTGVGRVVRSLPMTRQEFERTVRAMQDEGVPLTMANLLVRTELPRAQIEEWLDAMQRDVKFEVPGKAPEAAEKERDEGRPSGVMDRAQALKREVVGEVIRSRLGVPSEEASAAGRPRRDVKVGAALGFLLPPLGLAYSAPWATAAVGTVAYLALVWLSIKLSWLFGLVGFFLPLHLVGGILGAGYAWRFNRKGRRTPLLPSGTKKSRGE
jgi:hypothetical protein